MALVNTEKKLAIIISFFILLFAYGIYNLFQPDRFPISFVRGKAYQLNEEIIMGPYPSAKEMLRLKRLGVTTFINLMSLEVPIEHQLIKKQLRLCKKFDLVCRNFPLSFIILKSKSNLDQVEAVINYVKTVPGKKYIHCYLGRHRVELVKTRLEEEPIK